MRTATAHLRIITGSIALLVALSLLTSCNTVEGAGRDLEAVGEGISDIASDLNPSK